MNIWRISAITVFHPLYWTGRASPYIAALFAFDEVPADADRVVIYAFIGYAGNGKCGSPSKPQITTHGPYIKGHRRHFLQQAEYSTCTVQDNGVYKYAPYAEDSAVSGDNQDIRWKITLPASEREVALKELERMNITPYSLFGSEESLMKTIGRREFGGERYKSR